MMEDIEEDVVFKGSALYAHLATLQLTEEEDHHPLLPSLQAAVDGCSPDTVRCGDAQQPPGRKHSLYQRLYHWSWGHIESLFDSLFDTNKSEQRLLWRLATLLCSRGLLTQDDRLHLYYFSPVFSQLVEEPSLAADDSLGGSANTSTRSATVGTALAATTAACCGGWAALNLSGSDALRPWLGGTVLCCILLPGLVAATAIGCTFVVRWHAKRYERCFSGLERVLGSLAVLQHSCLPHAFAAAADAGLLTGPHDSETASTPLIRRVRQELLQLQRLLHSTLQCALQLVGGPGTAGALDREGQKHAWPATKAARRQLEALVSAYARDIMLQAERAFGKDSSLISGSPCAPPSTFSPMNVSSVLTVVTEACAALAEQLPQMESYSSRITSQVKLLRHCWLYSGEETRPREVQTEEQAAADTLNRHLQTGLRQLEQARVVLLTLTDSSAQVESEQLATNDTISKGSGLQHRDVDEDSVTAFEVTYHSVCSQLKELRATVDLCLNDVTVLEESVAWRRLRLLQQLGRSEAGTQEPTAGTLLPPDDEVALLTSSDDAVELVPYIAEDEVFEASTEAAEDEGGEGRGTASSSDWLAEAEEDQQRKKLRACGRRLLAELQPILDTKKKEFQEREKRAWKRMKGDDGGGEAPLEDGANQTNSAASVTASSHNGSPASNAGSSTPSPCGDSNRSLGAAESIPSTVNNDGDTVATLTNTGSGSSRKDINAVKNDCSSNDDNRSISFGTSTDVKLGLKTNDVVLGHNSRVLALDEQSRNSAILEPSDNNLKTVNNLCSTHDPKKVANSHAGPLDEFWYFLLPVAVAAEATVPGLVDVFGVGRTPSTDGPLLLPLLRVPLAGHPRLNQSASSSRSDPRASKLAQLESWDAGSRRNGLSKNNIDFIAASVDFDAPPVMDYEDSYIKQFISDNNSRLPLVNGEEEADHQTERMRQSFLNACDATCWKTVQLLTRTWPIFRQKSSKKNSELSRESRFNDIGDNQSTILRLDFKNSVTESINTQNNTPDLSPKTILTIPFSEDEENELPIPSAATRSYSSASVTAVLPKMSSASHEYTSYSGDSCDDDVTANTLPPTLGEDQPTSPPVAQVFTSDPSTDGQDGTTLGESSWNLEEKPVDLQGRLKMLLQSHMQERGVEDVEGVEEEGRDREGGVSLGFHSQLALQAVQMSSKFGMSGGCEEMFGGVGENEAVFGDSSTDEEGDDTDSGGEGEGWAQTEM